MSRGTSPLDVDSSDEQLEAGEAPVACPVAPQGRVMTTVMLISNLQEQAHALLDALGDYPTQREDQGLQPSLLRYKVRTSEEVSLSKKQGYDALGSSGERWCRRSSEWIA